MRGGGREGEKKGFWRAVLCCDASACTRAGAARPTPHERARMRIGNAYFGLVRAYTNVSTCPSKGVGGIDAAAVKNAHILPRRFLRSACCGLLFGLPCIDGWMDGMTRHGCIIYDLQLHGGVPSHTVVILHCSALEVSDTFSKLRALRATAGYSDHAPCA